MVDGIRSTSPVKAPTPAPPVVAAPAPVAVVADRLALSPARPLLEADLRLTMTGSALATGNGTIKVDHRLVERFAGHVLNDPGDFRSMAIAFDPATKAFGVKGKIVFAGIGWPFTAKARPSVVDGQIGVTFAAIQLKLGPLTIGVPGFISRRVLGTIQRQFSDTRVRTTADPAHMRLLLDPASLLHEIGVVPPYLGLDAKQTTLTMANQANGDVHVTMASSAAGLPIAETPTSDVSVALDEKALEAVLKRALAADYEISELKLTVNGVALKGRVEYAPISDAINGFQAIALLIALESGRRDVNYRPVKTMGPLGLDVKIEGQTLVIKPDMNRALKPLLAVLEKAGVASSIDGKTLRVDLAAIAAKQGVDLEELKLGQGSAQVKVHLNADALLLPKLR